MNKQELVISDIRKTMIIFNAPKNTGKDVACEYLLSLYPNAEHRFFKEELYELTSKYYNMELDKLIELATDRQLKEIPNVGLDMKSPRKALIHVSEDVITPFYGKDYFGRVLAFKCSEELVFVSDGGFNEEIKAVIDNSNYDVHIIQIYRDGYTFEGDSRDYISVYGKTHIIHNNGTLDEFLNKVHNTVKTILQEN